MVDRRDRAEPAGARVGGEAPSADRRVVHDVDKRAGLLRGLDVRRDDALGTLVQGAEHQARLALAGTDEHRDAVDLRQGDVRPKGQHIRGAVLTVDENEVEAGDREHLDDVLARHPHQRPHQLVSRRQPGLDRAMGRGDTVH